MMGEYTIADMATLAATEIHSVFQDK